MGSAMQAVSATATPAPKITSVTRNTDDTMAKARVAIPAMAQRLPIRRSWALSLIHI